MKCPKCGARIKTLTIAQNKKANEVYRHKICTKCAHEFFTVEFEFESETGKKYIAKWRESRKKKKK